MKESSISLKDCMKNSCIFAAAVPLRPVDLEKSRFSRYRVKKPFPEVQANYFWKRAVCGVQTHNRVPLGIVQPRSPQAAFGHPPDAILGEANSVTFRVPHGHVQAQRGAFGEEPEPLLGDLLPPCMAGGREHENSKPQTVSHRGHSLVGLLSSHRPAFSPF